MILLQVKAFEKGFLSMFTILRFSRLDAFARTGTCATNLCVSTIETFALLSTYTASVAELLCEVIGKDLIANSLIAHEGLLVDNWLIIS